jgi:hypothetical protein
MELTLGEEEQITTFAQAVQHVSGLAQAKLPVSLHGNVQRATALVLGAHVWMDEDGRHGQVLSSDGTTWYVCNGHCTCMGVTHAPQGLCKHRLSLAIYRRSSELLAAAPSAAPAQGAPAALPEAPASVNVRLFIGGADVQWTLRDQCEDRLAARLERLLARFPQTAQATSAQGAPAASAPGKPTCPHHGPGKESTKAPGTWYCTKKMADGTYCPWRHPAA